ncbi:intraflagellar transport protein 20 homolog [Cimex lectularius]|uniref:Intraflagellar transport 20 n=1 Tax=Cimex lectularius TaxID=79782 RepID=A0A8I6S399_CIMLE|nr:intraflagellar transport protein 20 homolog [Cimex lectularius]XP_014255358.1 intraflagellar transport protein 20 homolog [Cimex lectularius]XP_014255359.1 intraflagellar transport protein 20 homolog [Cimex lectularius]XP_014255360.1 intraflagellar transport protein 20 homolog [Cimex lectularius]
MSERLAELALHFDELSRLRIVEPEVASKTNDLKEECNEFVNSIESFQGIADGFIGIIDGLAQEVNKEKIKAIGARNLVKSMAKQRDAQEQQLKALLLEKSTELERLRIQHQSLLRTESVQVELLDRLLLNQ